jgi:DNA modification methylase
LRVPRPPRDRPEPSGRPPREKRPPLRIFPTTLWEYPSQHYDSPAMREAERKQRLHRGEQPREIVIQGDAVVGSGSMQGDKDYVGATPSWVIWQLLSRYTREGDTVVDPMCGSGTTLDVCRDLGRKGLGFDLNPQRPEIRRNDSRRLPLDDASVDFAFIDPPYSTAQAEGRRGRRRRRVHADRLRALRDHAALLHARRHHRGRPAQQEAPVRQLAQGRRGGELLPPRVQLLLHHEEGRRLTRARQGATMPSESPK